MKKIVFTFVMVVALSFSVCGQNSNRKILMDLSHSDDVERISVSLSGMFLAKLFGGLEDMPELKGIQSVEIMTVSNECSDNRQKEIKKQIASLSDDAEYTTLISIKGEEDKVRLMARQENDMIKELLFVVLEKEDDSVVIRIKGKMNLSDVQSMIEKGEISKN